MPDISVEAQITKIFDEYSLKVSDAAEAACKEAAELTARTLKQTSPARSGRGGGKYRRGWRVKKRENGLLVSYLVFNGSQPGLTHLLEHGHVARNQYGTWGRVRAIPHIGRAAESGLQRLDLALRARLRK